MQTAVEQTRHAGSFYHICSRACVCVRTVRTNCSQDPPPPLTGSEGCRSGSWARNVFENCKSANLHIRKFEITGETGRTEDKGHKGDIIHTYLHIYDIKHKTCPASPPRERREIWNMYSIQQYTTTQEHPSRITYSNTAYIRQYIKPCIYHTDYCWCIVVVHCCCPCIFHIFTCMFINIYVRQFQHSGQHYIKRNVGAVAMNSSTYWLLLLYHPEASRHENACCLKIGCMILLPYYCCTAVCPDTLQQQYYQHCTLQHLRPRPTEAFFVFCLGGARRTVAHSPIPAAPKGVSWCSIISFR